MDVWHMLMSKLSVNRSVISAYRHFMYRSFTKMRSSPCCCCCCWCGGCSFGRVWRSLHLSHIFSLSPSLTRSHSSSSPCIPLSLPLYLYLSAALFTLLFTRVMHIHGVACHAWCSAIISNAFNTRFIIFLLRHYCLFPLNITHIYCLQHKVFAFFNSLHASLVFAT